MFAFHPIGQSTMQRLSLFYQQVLAPWLLMGNNGDIGNLTSQTAYRRIQPAITHRCVAKFQKHHLDWPALWHDIDLLFLNKAVWKTNFLVLHGILPTMNRLARWGITPRNTLCHCGQRKTQEHCTLTLVLVHWFEELLGIKWPNHRLSNAHIWFGFPASAGILAGFKFILATQ